MLTDVEKEIRSCGVYYGVSVPNDYECQLLNLLRQVAMERDAATELCINQEEVIREELDWPLPGKGCREWVIEQLDSKVEVD